MNFIERYRICVYKLSSVVAVLLKSNCIAGSGQFRTSSKCCVHHVCCCSRVLAVVASSWDGLSVTFLRNLSLFCAVFSHLHCMLLTRLPVLCLLAICSCLLCIVFWLVCPCSWIVLWHSPARMCLCCHSSIAASLSSKTFVHRLPSMSHLKSTFLSSSLFCIQLLSQLFSQISLCGRSREDLGLLLRHFISQTRHQIDCTTLGGIAAPQLGY